MLPKWYTKAVAKKQFYESDEFQEALDQMIEEYSEAKKRGDDEMADRIGHRIVYVQTERASNEIMIKQHRI